jgi:redox-sensing transcriptional repressor
LLGIDATLVRKDMAAAGVVGRPKVGYPINAVLPCLDRLLGLTGRNDAILIGCGDLGSALARYGGFSKYGLKISGLFDVDAAKLGQTIGGLTVLPMEKCRNYIDIFGIRMAILAVPASAAQDLTDWLVGRGVCAIWNFAPVHLKVPPGSVVRNENLALGLAQLLHELQRSRGTTAAKQTTVPVEPS